MAQHADRKIKYRYDDFVLKLRRTEMEYTIEAQAPSGDRRKLPVALRQWSEDITTFTHYFQRQAEQAEAEQAKTDQTQGQIVATDKVRAFGRQLFTALFQGGILTLYRQSLEDIVKARDDAPAGYTRGLRIVLDLEHAPDLTRIPWEFLYDAEKEEGEKFLCLDPQTPVVRRLRFGARRHYEVNPPLLFALFSANPRGTIPLGEQNREIRAIGDILDRHPSVELKDKSAAPASDILKIMQNWPHIVHFTGHGSGHSLAFEDVELPANQLKRLINVNRALRLVVINACEAGKEVTETLARSGIPAIIAMQFMISDPASLAFAQIFYENLVAGHSLETSLSFARLEMGRAISKIIPTIEESFEWATPVLYLQSPSSEEVLVEALTIPSGEREQVEESSIFLPDAAQKRFRFLMDQGQDLYKKGQPREALAFLEGADRLWHPSYGEFKQDIVKLTQLCENELQEKRFRSQNDLSKMTLFESAQNYADEKCWDKAFNLLQTIGRLEELEELRRSEDRRDPVHPTLKLSGEINKLYQRVRKERDIANDCQARRIRLKALYNQGEKGWCSQDWSDAIIFFEGAAEEVKALEDRNAEADERYLDAGARAVQARKQKQLHQLYQDGISLAEQQRWHEAVNAFEQIIELDPSFPNVHEQLEEVRQERDMEDAYRRGMHAIRDRHWQIAISDLQTIQSGALRYQDAHLALQYAQGGLYIERGEWARAVEALDTVVRSRPDFEGDAQQRYQDALFRRDLEARYQEGCRRMEAGEWQKAKADLQWVKNEQQNREALVYPDVDQRLNQIEEEIFLAAQYQQAQRFLATENWERAISHLQTILNLDDDYQDTPKLLKQTQAHQGAEAAYQRGIEATLNRDWPTAIQAFEETLRLQPDHGEAPKRLKTAQHNQNLEDNYREGIAAYRRGDANYDLTALEKAIRYLEQVVQADPEFRDAADRLKESQRLLEAERNYQTAIQAEKAKEWAQAVEAWQRVADLALELSREYRDAASRLKRAIQHKELADLHHQAQTHRSNEDWSEAAAVLADLVARAADYGLAPYEDTQAQLEEAKRRAKIATLFDDGLLCMRAERWDDAITMFREVIRLDPEHGPALVQLEEAERQIQLQAEYQAGMGAIQTRDWPTAIRYLKQVVEEDRDYKNAAAQLETARHQQKLADLYRRGMEHADRDEWDQAFACFDDVKRDDPDYRDVQTQWRRAYEYKEINQLYQRARKLEDEGKLEEAIRYYNEVEKRRQNVLDR